MKTLTAIVLLLIVAAVVVVIVGGAVRRAIRRWREKRAPWVMVEDSDGEAVKVLAEKPGDERLLIGYVPFGAADFDARLYEVRAEGREKVYALNQGRHG